MVTLVARQPSAAAPLPRRPWLREPLLHFVVIGAALFVGYSLLHPLPTAGDSDRRIVLTQDDLRQLSVAVVAQGRPAPTPEQMRSLIESRVQQEVLYREALALGLDKDDAIIKRRLAQKMEFLAEDLAATDPKPDELEAWFQKNADQFVLPPRAWFRHLYFSPDRRGERTRNDAEAALARLRDRRADAAASAGDPFMFQDRYSDRSPDEVAAQFGPEFAQSLFTLEPSSWQGPIASGYGWHLVWIDSITSARHPNFEEVEPEVRNAWVADQRAEAKRRLFEELRARYEVVLAKGALAAVDR
jgi:peptidyl-prolyl cis-trans isomerase C